jgi:peptidoglycan hydrolase-like protein with peptidoglycan-binding domain
MRARLNGLAAAALLLALGAAPALATATAPADRLAVELAATAATGQDAALYQIYKDRSFQPLWLGDAARGRRATLAALLARESRFDPGTGVDLGRLLGKAGTSDQVPAELALTRAFVSYLGRRSPSGHEPGVAAVERALLQLEKADTGTALALALVELRMVDAVGGWATVTTTQPPAPAIAAADPLAEVELLTYVSAEPLGGSSYLDAPVVDVPKPEVDATTLRARLAQSGDLPASLRAGNELDGRVLAALRAFQERHGLLVDGVVGPRTLATLNERVGFQIRQVELNIVRARAAAGRDRLHRYVEVNVPAYALKLVEDGKTILEARAIVGDEDKATPIFDDRIRFVEFNPSWYVPRSIERELLDKAAGDPGYFGKNGFVWRGGAAADDGEPPARRRLVQLPGPENALGRMKFLFPNHNAVYIHDTPQRGMFGRSTRSLSHGCIRVENPENLAVALLGPQGWNAGRIDKVLGTTQTQRVALTAPVPVFLDYRTAFVDESGRLELRADIYGHDAAGIGVFAGKGLPPVVPVATPALKPAAPPPLAAPPAAVDPTPPAIDLAPPIPPPPVDLSPGDLLPIHDLPMPATLPSAPPTITAAG